MVGIQQNLQQELQTFNPAQRAIQNLVSPPTPYGQGIVPVQRTGPGLSQFGAAPGGVPGFNIGGKQQFGGVPPEATASFKQYQSVATSAIAAIEQKASEGEAQLRKLGVPESVISSVKSLTNQIQDISAQESNEQLSLQYAQYNHQLYLAKRQLGDIAGLTGRSGATEIGILQRQELLLGRKTTQLGLQSQLLGLQSLSSLSSPRSSASSRTSCSSSSASGRSTSS